jgi:hypothetical protein
MLQVISHLNSTTVSKIFKAKISSCVLTVINHPMSCALSKKVSHLTAVTAGPDSFMIQSREYAVRSSPFVGVLNVTADSELTASSFSCLQ